MAPDVVVYVAAENKTKEVCAQNIVRGKRPRAAPSESGSSVSSSKQARKKKLRVQHEDVVEENEAKVFSRQVEHLQMAGWQVVRQFIKSERYIHDVADKLTKGQAVPKHFVHKRFKDVFATEYEANRELVAEVLFKNECANGAVLHLVKPNGRCGYAILHETQVVARMQELPPAQCVCPPSDGSPGETIKGLRALLTRAGMLESAAAVQAAMLQRSPDGIAGDEEIKGIADVTTEQWQALASRIPGSTELLNLTNDFGLCAALTIGTCMGLSTYTILSPHWFSCRVTQLPALLLAS